ncbi:MAG: hypothetical protein QMD99_08900 [Rhizobiaceae bacterium]|nr:hypothetical protein [Rhizobiaceae bacterium]
MEYGIPSDVWFPVVTLIIGSVLKGLYDLMADQRVERREKAARLEMRHDAQMLRKTEFQRKTILELQEEVAKLARATGQMNHADSI